jgi:predicted peptidase
MLWQNGDKGFRIETYTRKDGSSTKFGQFVPLAYNDSKKYPVIIFLHGLGEGGTDAKANLRVGLAPFVADQADRFGFICLFPQSPSGSWRENSREADDVIGILDAVGKKFPGADMDRVSLTGLSTGGYGTYAIGAQFKDRFACLAPMGSNEDYHDPSQLVGIPIHAIYNSGDMFAHDEGMINRIKSAGGNADYEVYDAAGHDCWERAYSEGGLFAWMQTQHRRVSARPAMITPDHPTLVTPSTSIVSRPTVASMPAAQSPVAPAAPASRTTANGAMNTPF